MATLCKQCYVIKFCVQLYKMATDTYTNLTHAFGHDVSCNLFIWCFKDFKECRDDPESQGGGVHLLQPFLKKVSTQQCLTYALLSGNSPTTWRFQLEALIKFHKNIFTCQESRYSIPHLLTPVRKQNCAGKTMQTVPRRAMWNW